MTTSLCELGLSKWPLNLKFFLFKGLAATHLRDIEKYFYGAHVTIHARNEDEIDEKELLAKVSKVSASAYNFKEKQSYPDVPPAPVGSVHQKINPKSELPNLDEREKFWMTEESREKEVS